MGKDSTGIGRARGLFGRALIQPGTTITGDSSIPAAAVPKLRRARLKPQMRFRTLIEKHGVDGEHGGNPFRERGEEVVCHFFSFSVTAVLSVFQFQMLL